MTYSDAIESLVVIDIITISDSYNELDIINPLESFMSNDIFGF